MNTGEILKQLKTQWAGRSIAFFEEIDSTNISARQLGEKGAPEGTLVIADCQTGGRGRLGRQWFSPSGTGIWMTMVLRPELSPEKVSAITLVSALSVCRALGRITGLDISIKWPNDLVVDGKKICGILTEMSLEPGRIHYVVLGIGINVNQTEFPEELPHAWSLAMAAGRNFSREEIIVEIWNQFEKDYEIYRKTGDLAGLKAEYESCLANLNQKVQVLAPAGAWVGVAEGITPGGDLLVRDETGEVRAVNSGEVSVRGVYGYV